MGRKAMKKTKGSDRDKFTGNLSAGVPGETFKAKQLLNHQEASVPQKSFLRKQVDPETAKYFAEIGNVIEGTEIDLEEQSSICGNALEETRGKGVELATDYTISHTLERLLEKCAVDHLCTFLQNCSKDFPRIAMDRSGSHVAETALRSLAAHIQDNNALPLVEATLNDICQAIVVNPVDVMINCYGSHVLRSLMCLCKGVPLDSSDVHSKNSSSGLAGLLNFKSSRLDENESQEMHLGFPDMLKFLVSEMLKSVREDIEALQVDQYSSLVLQTALKLLAGDEEELMQVIPAILGCDTVNATDGNIIENIAVNRLWRLKGHFGELSVIPSGAFTVEKCFDVSSLSFREVIVSELLTVQSELSKTRQGPLLLRKFDVEGYGKQPDQWKLRQASKESAYNDFIATFGSKEAKSSKYDASFTVNCPKPQQEKLKDLRKEIDTRLTSTTSGSPFLANKPFKKSGQKRHSDIGEGGAGKFTKHAIEEDVGKSKQKSKRKGKRED